MSRCFHYLFFHQCFWITLISNPWNLDHTLEMPSYLHLPHLLRPPKGITDHRNTKPFKRSKLEGNQILKYHEYTTKIRKVKVKHTLKNINMRKYKQKTKQNMFGTWILVHGTEIWTLWSDQRCDIRNKNADLRSFSRWDL